MVLEIEAKFVPLAIRNNTGGTDAKILNSYGEPSWNNPVVRFVDSKGKDVISRKGGVYSKSGIKDRMDEALKAFKPS